MVSCQGNMPCLASKTSPCTTAVYRCHDQYCPKLRSCCLRFLDKKNAGTIIASEIIVSCI